MATETLRHAVQIPDRLDTQRGLPFAGVAFLVLLWLLVVLASLDLSGLSVRSALLIADACVLFVPLVVKAASNSLDIFEPLVVMNLSLAGMFLGRPLADIVTGKFIEHGYDISSSFDEALFVVLIGNLCCQIGYLSPFSRVVADWLPHPSRHFDVNKGALWAAFIASVGLGLFGVFAISQGGIRFLIVMLAGRSSAVGNAYWESSGYLYGAIGLLVPASIIFFGLWAMTRRPAFLIGAIVTGFPYMLVTASQGARSGMIGLLFSAPMIWYLTKRRRPSPVMIATSLFILMALFGFVRTHRTAGHNRNKPEQSFDAVQSALSLFASDDDEMFDVTALEVEYVPKFMPFHPFGVATDIVYRGVPRVLYPNKPLDIATSFWSAMLPARAKSTHSRGGTASSLAGGLYMDSGIVTVAFWMFAIGVVFGTAWLWYQQNRDSPSALLIYSVAPSVIVNLFRGSIAGAIASGFFTILPLLLLPLILKFKATH
jgi:oligosaccharide repeat unit polymerase